jgi:hypothetical protein
MIHNFDIQCNNFSKIGTPDDRSMQPNMWQGRRMTHKKLHLRWKYTCTKGIYMQQDA